MLKGLTSDEIAGEAPEKCHTKMEAFVDALIKLIQDPLQISVSEVTKSACGCKQFVTLIKLLNVFTDEQKPFETVSMMG